MGGPGLVHISRANNVRATLHKRQGRAADEADTMHAYIYKRDRRLYIWTIKIKVNVAKSSLISDADVYADADADEQMNI